MQKIRKLALAVVAASTFVGAAACSSGSTGSGGGETVSVDVGTDKPVKLTTDKKLRVALFINAQTNKYQQELAAGAKEQAEKYGWDYKLFQADFDLQTQISQLQQAAVSKQLDAIAVTVIDGEAECNVLTKTLPQANILVTTVSSPICGRTDKTGDDVWAPGTLNYNDYSNTYDGFKTWLEATAQAFAGPQNVLFVGGPESNPGLQAQKKIIAELAKEYPDFKVKDWIYTDYTTTDTQSKTRTYLQGHPEIDVIIDGYSPDLARGVVNAVQSLGLEDKIQLSDFGGSEYTVPFIKSGLIKLTFPYYPRNMGANVMSSIKQAQDGKKVDRARSELPGGGDFTPEDTITKDNVASYKPQY